MVMNRLLAAALEALNLVIVLVLIAGGAISLVILIEKHLRAIRTNAMRQTELLEQLADMAKSDTQAANEPGDGGFGAPAWARTGRGY